MLKLNLYNVTNGTVKARVYYSENVMRDGRPCVTIYDKDCGSNRFIELFGDLAKNDTDIMTDYFEKSSVTLFKGDTLYEAALKHAKTISNKYRQKAA